MSERPWTPGPWSTHPEDLRGGRYWVIDMPGMATDDYFDEPFAIHESDNGEANASLIAAAPDLYEALETAPHLPECLADFLSSQEASAACKAFPDIFAFLGSFDTWENGAARAALAKADGRSPSVSPVSGQDVPGFTLDKATMTYKREGG